MKTWRTIQKIAVAVGMSYGLWLGTNVDATDADSRNAFVIIALSVIVAISLYMPDKTDTATVQELFVQQVRSFPYHAEVAGSPVRCRGLHK